MLYWLLENLRKQQNVTIMLFSFFLKKYQLKQIKGSALNELGLFEEALKYFDELLKINPNCYEAYNLKGVALKNLNRIEEALHNYTKAIEIKPDWHPPYINKRILLESQGMFSQALKCNEEAEQNVQKQYHNSELPQKGNILLKQNRLQEAIECYENALQVNQLDPEVYLNRQKEQKKIQGIALWRLKYYDKALYNVEKAIQINSLSSRAFTLKGLVQQSLGKLEEAQACLYQAIKLDPTDSDAYNSLSDCLIDQKKYLEALSYVNQAIIFDPKNSEYFINKGRILFCLDQINEALNCFEKAIEKNQQSIKAYFHKGIALSKLKQHEQAYKCFSQALKLNPKDGLIQYQIDVTQIQIQAEQLKIYEQDLINSLDQPENEDIQCKQLLEMDFVKINERIKADPLNHEVYNFKGKLLIRYKKFEAALECFKKAVIINEQYYEGQKNKGETLYFLERYEEALECFDKAIDINPIFDEVYFMKGAILNYFDRNEEAFDCFNEGLKINPLSEKFFFQRAITYEYMEHYEEALRFLDEEQKTNYCSQLHTNRATLLAKMQRFKEAYAECDIAEEMGIDLEDLEDTRNLIHYYKTGKI